MTTQLTAATNVDSRLQNLLLSANIVCKNTRYVPIARPSYVDASTQSQ